MAVSETESDVVFVVGDIHGMADLLEDLHACIVGEADIVGAKRPKIVYVGDYIDRGPDSRRVVDLVMAGLPGFISVPLMGNHEEMMLEFLRDPTPGSSRFWIGNGGSATLNSYGIFGPDMMTPESAVKYRDRLLGVMPPEHHRFFKNLALRHEDGHAIYVHGGLNPNVPLTAQSQRDMLWIRGPFLQSEKDWGKPVVHGHTITMSGPQNLKTRIGIDTGAFASGVLTAVVLRAGERYFMSVQNTLTIGAENQALYRR